MNAKIKHPEIEVVYKMPHCKVEKNLLSAHVYTQLRWETYEISYRFL